MFNIKPFIFCELNNLQYIVYLERIIKDWKFRKSYSIVYSEKVIKNGKFHISSYDQSIVYQTHYHKDKEYYKE